MKVVSPEDLCALREVAKESNVRDYAIVTILATSGVRAGEMVSMTMENLKLSTGEVLVYGKRGWRKVYLGKESTEAIKVYIEERPDTDEDALWLNVYGKPLTTDGIRQLIDRLAERANVEGRHNLHAFRHRFAQAWLDKGMNAQILSKALGHADVTVTLLIYGNQDDRRVAKAMRQLEMSPFEDPQGLEEL
ncbi:MAG TPA: tyrosine-type recombinase/integrase [Caldilineaceae bacterium]|nr:tyrosine-type recombinase/integrase [Caldilineaceae bacterium]